MAQKLSEEEARRRLNDDLQAWTVREGELYRIFRTANWRVTLMTANVIGFLAEAAYHHPRLVLNYRSVEVYLSTHDADGLTENDFDLARQIEKTVRWPAEEVGKLDAPPRDWLRE